jgi:hypothetical protein
MLSNLLLGVAVVVAMIVCAWRAWLGERWAALVLALLAFVWLRIDKRFEGPHLIVFGNEHGLVVADLVGILAIAVAALGLWRARSRSRKHNANV